MDHRWREQSYVNGILIAANALFFLYLEIAGSSEDVAFMLDHGAMFVPAVMVGGEYYRLLTSMFMHFGINHIINNMIVLFVLGDHLERALGHVRYLIFYLLSGLAANVVSMLAEGADSRIVSAGASGAVFGVAGGLLYAVFINQGRLGDLTMKQIAVMAALSLYLGFQDIGVDNVAHVSGLIAGMLLAFIMYRKPETGRNREENEYYEGF